jgi:Polyketide cyclase / dehydrase and lipid transport
MVRIEEQVVIGVRPADVFDYRLDFGTNLVTYNPNVREVVQVEGTGPGVGSKYWVRLRLGPGFTTTSLICVTEALRPSRVCDVAESFLDAHEMVTFEPVALGGGRSGTEVCFVVESRPRSWVQRLVAAVLVPLLARRQVRTELRLMCRELEARARG